MRYVQTRYLIAAGFFIMGSAFLYSSHLVAGHRFRAPWS